jgi:hypothetical protein
MPDVGFAHTLGDWWGILAGGGGLLGGGSLLLARKHRRSKEGSNQRGGAARTGVGRALDLALAYRVMVVLRLPPKWRHLFMSERFKDLSSDRRARPHRRRRRRARRLPRRRQGRHWDRATGSVMDG